MASGLFSSSGSFNNTMSFLKAMQNADFLSGLDSIGQQGVNALAALTPIDSGLTASSWGYEITSDGDSTTISWINTHINGTVNVAVILQYGHATGTGGYVPGIDYINPAIQPIFEQISEDVWRKVTNA